MKITSNPNHHQSSPSEKSRPPKSKLSKKLYGLTAATALTAMTAIGCGPMDPASAKDNSQEEACSRAEVANSIKVVTTKFDYKTSLAGKDVEAIEVSVIVNVSGLTKDLLNACEDFPELTIFGSIIDPKTGELSEDTLGKQPVDHNGEIRRTTIKYYSTDNPIIPSTLRFAIIGSNGVSLYKSPEMGQ